MKIKRATTKERWKKVKLDEVCDLNMGQSPDSKTYNNIGEGLPFFQGKTDFGSKYPSLRMYCREPKKIVDIGDLLISVRAPVGPVNIANVKSCIGRGLAGLRAKKDLLNQDYLYFSLILNKENIASLGTGSIFQSINKSQLENFEILLPSQWEQKSIARILTTIQEAITRQQEIIATLKELKRSMMQHLFTHGTKGEKIKMTEIGEVPESWKIIKLGDICQTSSGGTPSRTQKDFYNGTIPWFKSGEMDDGYIENSEERISEEAIKKSSAKLFKAGTLLVAMYGATAGKTAILNKDATTNQAVCAILKNSMLNLEFLRHYLIFIRDFLLDQRHGGAQPNLSQTNIQNLQIPLPNITEQDTIAENFIMIHQKIIATQEKLSTYQSLFKTLLHELISEERKFINNMLWKTIRNPK